MLASYRSRNVRKRILGYLHPAKILIKLLRILIKGSRISSAFLMELLWKEIICFLWEQILSSKRSFHFVRHTKSVFVVVYIIFRSSIFLDVRKNNLVLATPLSGLMYACFAKSRARACCAVRRGVCSCWEIGLLGISRQHHPAHTQSIIRTFALRSYFL